MMRMLFVLILIVTCGVAYGQPLTSFVNTTVKATTITYETVNKSGQTNFVVRNLANQLGSRNQKYTPEYLSIVLNEDSLRAAFKKVFTTERINQLIPEPTLLMMFYLNPSGNVLEVYFILPKTTLLTVQELEKLEITLKKDVKFKLSAPGLEKGDFYLVVRTFSYAVLLSK